MVSCIADEIRVTPDEVVYVCRHNLVVKIRPGKLVLESPSSEYEYTVKKVEKAPIYPDDDGIRHTHYYLEPNPTGEELITVSHGKDIPVTGANKLEL